jgi:hypothetical protein
VRVIASSGIEDMMQFKSRCLVCGKSAREQFIMSGIPNTYNSFDVPYVDVFCSIKHRDKHRETMRKVLQQSPPLVNYRSQKQKPKTSYGKMTK